MSDYFDRFNSPYYQLNFPDPQEKEVYARCFVTDAEIYEGELYIETSDGRILKYDLDVLIEHVNARVRSAGEEEY